MREGGNPHPGSVPGRMVAAGHEWYASTTVLIPPRTKGLARTPLVCFALLVMAHFCVGHLDAADSSSALTRSRRVTEPDHQSWQLSWSGAPRASRGWEAEGRVGDNDPAHAQTCP